MGISVIGSSASSSGGSASGFQVSFDDSLANNTIQLDREYPAGGYEISLAIEDATFDIYGMGPDGSFTGYTNSLSVVFTAPTSVLAIYGTVANQKYTFGFSGGSSSPSSAGDAEGAGAYITAVTGSTNLAFAGDTTTISGGNFRNDLRVWFIGQDAVEVEAPAVMVSSTTAATITRPAVLLEALAPYTLKVKNNSIPEPIGTGVHILEDAVSVGTSPTWVTNTYVTPFFTPGTAYSAAIQATDPEGGSVTYSIVDGVLQDGLSLNSSTGVISGTTSLTDTRQVTFRATDQGGAYTDRTLMISYLGSWSSYIPQDAKELESYSFQFLATTSEEVNYSNVSYGAGGWDFDGEVLKELTVIRGERYEFSLDSTGHPFNLQTAAGAYDAGSLYTTGITNSGTQSGLFEWTVDAAAPNTLYYADQNDPSNYGIINVIDQPATPIGTPVYTVVSGSLPDGLSLATNGYLTGTPTTPGQGSAFTVRATFSQQGYVETEAVIDTATLNSELFTSNTTWTVPFTGDVAIVAVGGGGSGACRWSYEYGCCPGGGGGGGIQTATVSATTGDNFYITIGSGGSSVSGNLRSGNTGNTTSVNTPYGTYSAAGGGGGGVDRGGYSSYNGAQVNQDSGVYNGVGSKTPMTKTATGSTFVGVSMGAGYGSSSTYGYGGSPNSSNGTSSPGGQGAVLVYWHS